MNDTTGIDLKRPRTNLLSQEQIRLLGLVAVFLIFLIVFAMQAMALLESSREKKASVANFLTNSASSSNKQEEEKTTVQTTDTSELIDVQIYVARKGSGLKLVSVTRKIPKPAGKKELIAKLLEQLQVTPDNASLRATLPEGTELLSLFIKNRVIYLNLNVELVRKGHLSPLESFITLQSIANTITALSYADRVKFLIGGRERLTLQGHFDLKRLWSFDPTIVYDVSDDTK